MALRFLSTAQKFDQTPDEKNIERLKSQSILLSSTMDYKVLKRDKKGKTTNIFLENALHKNRISQLLRNLENGSEEYSSPGLAQNVHRNSIESPF